MRVSYTQARVHITKKYVYRAITYRIINIRPYEIEIMFIFVACDFAFDFFDFISYFFLAKLLNGLLT